MHHRANIFSFGILYLNLMLAFIISLLLYYKHIIESLSCLIDIYLISINNLELDSLISIDGFYLFSCV